jgi:hypothetical protein
MSAERFPLTWPDGWKRTAASARTRAQFGKSTSQYDSQQNRTRYTGKARLSVAQAISRIAGELQRMEISEENVIVSTNVPVRLDGLPRSDRAEPADPGVAIYWRDRQKRQQCMAIDRYDRVADNLAAVAATLDAMRAIKRHGGAEILDRAFKGFAALPAGPRPWREVLGFQNGNAVSRELVLQRFLELARKRHPDKQGGSHEQMVELTAAREAALLEVA